MIGRCTVRGCGGSCELTLPDDRVDHYQGPFGSAHIPHRWVIWHPNPEETGPLSFCLACHAELCEIWLLRCLISGDMDSMVEGDHVMVKS